MEVRRLNHILPTSSLTASPHSLPSQPPLTSTLTPSPRTRPSMPSYPTLTRRPRAPPFMQVKRLNEELETLRAAAASNSTAASQTQVTLSADSKRLRQNLAQVEAELEAERAAHAADTQKYSVLVTQLQQANSRVRDEVSAISTELEQTRNDLTGKLERLEAERAMSTEQLRNQIGALQVAKDEQERSLRRAIERLRVEKSAIAEQLSERLRGLQADREADANHLHAKIDRLKTLQTAALAAGSARGRQLLYTEALKSPALLRTSSMSWRGEDFAAPTTPLSGSRSNSATSLHHEIAMAPSGAPAGAGYSTGGYAMAPSGSPAGTGYSAGGHYSPTPLHRDYQIGGIASPL